MLCYGENNMTVYEKYYKNEETVKMVDKYVSQGFSCAESTIRILMDVFGYEAEYEVFRMTSTFRGGAGIDGKCGIIEAALAFLSFISTEEEYKCTQEVLTEFSRELHRDMTEKFGGYQCDYLWNLFISQNQDIDINRNVDCIIEEGIVLVVDSVHRIMERMKNVG